MLRVRNIVCEDCCCTCTCSDEVKALAVNAKHVEQVSITLLGLLRLTLAHMTSAKRHRAIRAAFQIGLMVVGWFSVFKVAVS